jgi:hypothetical protein
MKKSKYMKNIPCLRKSKYHKDVKSPKIDLGIEFNSNQIPKSLVCVYE